MYVYCIYVVIWLCIYIYLVINYIHIYANLPVNVMVRLPHPQSRDSQGQEMFLTLSADKQTRNYHTECSNHQVPPINPKVKGIEL